MVDDELQPDEDEGLTYRQSINLQWPCHIYISSKKSKIVVSMIAQLAGLAIAVEAPRRLAINGLNSLAI